MRGNPTSKRLARFRWGNLIRSMIASILVAAAVVLPANAVAAADGPQIGAALEIVDGPNLATTKRIVDGPTDDDVPTVSSLELAEAEIGLAKRIVGEPMKVDDDRYRVTYELLVENSGGIDLEGVRVYDQLNDFDDYEIIEISSDGLTVNEDYDGDEDDALLDRNTTLASGESGLIELVIEFEGNSGRYENTAEAGAKYGDEGYVSDDSTNGTDPDPDEDGDPTNNSTITEFTLAEIGLAKKLVEEPLDNGDGSYTATYELLVENTGQTGVALEKVEDELTMFTDNEISYEITELSSDEFAVNEDYDGDQDTGLLAYNLLEAGESGTITLAVTFEPGTFTGPFSNTASVVAPYGEGVSVEDISTDGDDVDADGDLDPNNDSEPTVFSFAAEEPVSGSDPAPETDPCSVPGACFVVSGRVWFDQDLDSEVGDEEEDISNVDVELFSPGADQKFGTEDDELVHTATTASPYAFPAVVPGIYQIRPASSSIPAGMYLTDSASSAIVVTISDSDLSSVNIGYGSQTVCGTVSGATPETTVTVTDSAGNVLSTTTDASGQFCVYGTPTSPLVAGTATIKSTVGSTPVTATVEVGSLQTVTASLMVDSTENTVSSPQQAADSLPSAKPSNKLAFTGSNLLLAKIGMLLVGIGSFLWLGRRRWNSYVS